MKRFLFSILIVILCAACTDHSIPENTCEVSEPVKDLSWLANHVEEFQKSSMVNELYISQAKHRSQTVFIFANCCINCSSVYLVYNCAGERIGSIGDDQFDFNFLQQSTVIWKSANSTCTVQ